MTSQHGETCGDLVAAKSSKSAKANVCKDRTEHSIDCSCTCEAKYCIESGVSPDLCLPSRESCEAGLLLSPSKFCSNVANATSVAAVPTSCNSTCANAYTKWWRRCHHVVRNRVTEKVPNCKDDPAFTHPKYGGCQAILTGDQDDRKFYCKKGVVKLGCPVTCNTCSGPAKVHTPWTDALKHLYQKCYAVKYLGQTPLPLAKRGKLAGLCLSVSLSLPLFLALCLCLARPVSVFMSHV